MTTKNTSKLLNELRDIELTRRVKLSSSDPKYHNLKLTTSKTKFLVGEGH